MEPTGWTSDVFFLELGLYLVTALGMQLMTFEDMTYELRHANARLETAQAELRQLVVTDALTGCRNRRFFDEVITHELNSHRRYSTPMSLLFVDVDHFKTINDTLGHAAGDRVLREVAAFLMRNTRDADYVFRWGGDEFLLLLSCREDEAMRRGHDLQSGLPAIGHRQGTAGRRRPQLWLCGGLSRGGHRAGCAEGGGRTDVFLQARGARAGEPRGLTRRAGRGRRAAVGRSPIQQVLRAQQPPPRLAAAQDAAIAAGSSPDRIRDSPSFDPKSRSAASSSYSRHTACAASPRLPGRAGPAAAPARSVTIMKTPWHSSFAYLLDWGVNRTG